MIKLLQLEYAKWRKNSVIGILVFMFIVMLPSLIFIGKELDAIDIDGFNPDMFFQFPTMWGYLGFAGSWLAYFCLGLIAVFIVVNEVSYKTQRQNIITGMDRKEFFLSKVLVNFTLSLLATLLFTVSGIIIGLFHTKGVDFSDIFDNSWAIPRFFLMCFGYMSLGLFFGILIRKSGVAVLLYLLYVMMLEPIIKWVGLYAVQKADFLDNSIINYWPSNAIEDLMPFPIYHFAEAIPRKDIDFDFLLSYNQAAITTVIWIAILMFFSYRLMMKRSI